MLITLHGTSTKPGELQSRHQRHRELVDGIHPMRSRMTALEAAVIQRMLADPQISPTRRTLDPLTPLVVEELSVSEVGFITSFARNDAAKLFSEGTSMRWGKITGRLNSKVDVDFVVYVDDGFVSAVEGITFGGEAWPSSIEDFELIEMPES